MLAECVDSTGRLKGQGRQLKKIYPFSNVPVLLGTTCLEAWIDYLGYGYLFFPNFLLKMANTYVEKKTFTVNTHTPSTFSCEHWSILVFSQSICLSLCPSFSPSFFFSLYFELSCMHSYTFSWLLTSSLNFVHFNNFFVYVQAHFPARKENRSSRAKNYDLEIRRDLSLDPSNTRSYRAVNGRWRCCPSGGILPPHSLLLNLLQDYSLGFFEPYRSPFLPNSCHLLPWLVEVQRSFLLSQNLLHSLQIDLPP